METAALKCKRGWQTDLYLTGQIVGFDILVATLEHIEHCRECCWRRETVDIGRLTGYVKRGMRMSVQEKILEVLAEATEPMTAQMVADDLGATPNSISAHLKLLFDKKRVTRFKDENGSFFYARDLWDATKDAPQASPSHVASTVAKKTGKPNGQDREESSDSETNFGNGGRNLPAGETDPPENGMPSPDPETPAPIGMIQLDGEELKIEELLRESEMAVRLVEGLRERIDYLESLNDALKQKAGRSYQLEQENAALRKIIVNSRRIHEILASGKANSR